MNRPNWYPKGTLQEPFLPQDVDDSPFGVPNCAHLMPPVEAIPDLKDGSYSKWERLFGDIFYSGLSNIKLYPRKGIDPDKAWAHLIAIVGSYMPKHEYKTAAFIYLANLWFKDAKWVAKPRNF